MTILNDELTETKIVSPINDEINNKKEFLQNLLNGYLILGAVLFFAEVYLTLQSNTWWILIVSLFLFGFQLLITFDWKLKTEIRSAAFSILFLMVGTFSMVNFGFNALGFVYFLISVVIAAYFHSRNVWITAISIITLVIIVLTSLTNADILPISQSILQPNSLFFIISEISIFLFIAIALVIPLFNYVEKSKTILHRNQDFLNGLQESNQLLNANLEQINIEKTQQSDLLIKAKKLIDQIYKLENNPSFLQKSVEIINSAFEFGYCGLFLSDEKREFAILKAGTGEAGRAMLMRNHRLRIREEGMVGYVTARGDLRVSNNVKDDPYHKFNPLLPDSKAELVLPLKIAGETIGALDFQSNQTNTFRENVIEVLQLLADQLALIHIKNSETAQLTNKIQGLESASSKAVREYWRTRLKGSRKNLGYIYQNNKLSTVENITDTEVDLLQSNESKVKISVDKTKKESRLMVPISSQNETIGLVSVRYEGDVIPEELELLAKSLSEKLSIAIENAQLYEEIEEKTEREAVLNNISANVRSARDIESILQTTASELGKAMGVDEVRVHLKTNE